MTDGKSTWITTEAVAECVSGILIDHGRVLVEKRRADDEADPGFVLLPGGHVEPGESLGQALRREMREELGITIGEMKNVGSRYHTATDGERQRVHYFHINKWKGKIKSREAEKVYWESRPANVSDAKERRIVQKLLKQSTRS